MISSVLTTRHWLSIRIRVGCVIIFAIGSLLPPYIPKSALALGQPNSAEKQFLLVEDGFLMKSSMLTDYGARRAYTTGRIHIVKDGENLEKLANRYSISTDTIRWANDIGKNDPIHPEDEIVILPVDGVLHTVKRGQTLSRIAQLYQIDSGEILKQNSLESEFILAGQDLIIPDASPIIGEPTMVASVEAPVAAVTTSNEDRAPKQPDPEPEAAVVHTASEIVMADRTHGVLQKPCSDECFITQYYHGSHFALDLQERGGGNIYASEAGTVIRADYGWNGGYGNVIEIDHGNDLITLYAHNKKLNVKVGDRVSRGTKIADMGNTGLVYGKTGIHTHFEVRIKGVKKNPLLYIE
ncbi:peptidoglycan DD-metalloendopeptidase family protein [Candidatus Peregrinibacteria bacterium]|nr:peptidoglycan DD-metalloendopeptidase family protein [Candidatus Peregrinibacteria bacterium]MBT3598488.1 peptidoglycan DD-metalloendopeptidase family protein [Candidatus Peregrinibacteria bacterium]MBT4367170.1 peptidoglycan DD-metalloendopeptidase family protein [Candidatus Peregrinibacteria bacterium]MBT6730509.1 peptidoglycan DD-metalloendopeptidase family protein [Candidatus Peregrinibacteria bacterium]MBT7009379.1 peptidoglycan DD-metalloendopeptidase family protein [Candidatus Peregri